MTRIVLLTTAIVTGLVAANSAAAFGGRPGPDNRPAFSQMDTNGDGKVTVEEINAYPAVRMASRFDAIDTDADGVISKEEFANSAAAMQASRNSQRTERMMTRLDTDKDGAISEEEFAAVADQMKQRRSSGNRKDMGRQGNRGQGDQGQRGGGTPFWRN